MNQQQVNRAMDQAFSQFDMEINGFQGVVSWIMNRYSPVQTHDGFTIEDLDGIILDLSKRRKS